MDVQRSSIEGTNVLTELCATKRRLPSNRLPEFFDGRGEKRVFLHFVRWQVVIGDSASPEAILTQLVRPIVTLLTLVPKTRERRALTS